MNRIWVQLGLLGSVVWAQGLGGCHRAPATDEVVISHSGDTGDTAAQDPTDSEQRRAQMADQDATVFNDDLVLEYHFTIAPEDLEYLEQHGDEEQYVPAALRVVGEGIDVTFDQVGYRYKGAYTLHHCWDDFGGVRSYEGSCDRLSRKIKFNEYDPDGRLFGLKKLNLHAMRSDPSKMRERLGYRTFAAAGIMAPRAAYAKVYINGAYDGLFDAVEAIDGRFTAMRFPESGDGNLYKEVWPRADLEFAEEYVKEQLRTNDDDPNAVDVSDIIAFGKAVDATTPENFKEVMSQWTDVDWLVRYMVADRLMRNWDGITGFYAESSPHNFYWYHDNGDPDLFYLFPWDLTNVFEPFDMYMDPKEWCTADPIPDWNVRPMNCDPRPGCDATNTIKLVPPYCNTLLRNLVESSWDDFVAFGKAFLQEHFVPEDLYAQMDKWAAQIEEAVDADPLVDVNEWKRAVQRQKEIMLDCAWTFSRHMEQGIVDETRPEPPDPAVFDGTIPEGGLNVDGPNNFEFEGGSADNWASYISTSSSALSQVQAVWNQSDPIDGAADLAITVDFERTVGAWSEWAYVAFAAPAPVDLRDKSVLWLTAKSGGTPVNVRVRFFSRAYGQLWGGIWEEFHKSITVTSEPTTFAVEFDDLSYPSWAKDSWSEGQGWDYADGQAREEMLAQFTGVAFSLAPNFDASGEMPSQTQHVAVQVDNLLFQ